MTHLILNYKTNLYSKLLIVIFVCSTMLGCDDFVNIDDPNSQLVTSAVFENKATANAAITDLYAQMRENGFLSGKTTGLSHLLGIYSDELINYNNASLDISTFYSNSLIASNAYINSLWNNAYKQIYASNLAYHKLENSTTLQDADRNQFMGEALFIRSLNHFYLMWLYGEVPYVTGTDYILNNRVEKMNLDELTQRIIEDLERASDLLPENYITQDKARVNKTVVKAFLARVYLYSENWVNAIATASIVLNQTDVYQLNNELETTFLKHSPSTIWQLASAYNGHNTNEGALFIFESLPPQSLALNETLYQAFEVGDLRKEQWIRALSDGENIWYHPYKYKERNDTGTTLENSIQLRIAEQYLIRAEALLKMGDIEGCKEDLNRIRNNAGLANTDANNEQELLEAILKERRVELFTEQGHRFFDLKRTGNLNSVLAVKPGWNATDVLWPLPQNELLLNPLLEPQNPGY